ncbi:cadherin-like domain-containing protein, partial [Verrucomicrobia bacterium]|nr:cadherin-like domain-containing protein [Verrucomicrobiota bacterium]
MTIFSFEPSIEHGELEMLSNAFYFTPVPDFFGTVSFAYRIGVGELTSESIPVTIKVTSVNDPPLVLDDTIFLDDPSGPVLIHVLANDSSGVDLGEVLTILSAGVGSEGGQVEVTEGKVLYLPKATFSGLEQVDYQVSDGNGGIGSATVSIHVERPDRIDPVVICQDIELTLPESGDLLLDASLFDAGSHDESGGLVLSVEPRELGSFEVGDHEILVTGTDRSGNISTCLAHLTIVESNRDSVDLIYPPTRTVFRVSEDYFFNASDVPIEAKFSSDFDSIEIIGDGLSLVDIPVRAGQSSVIWVWEEVRWGDHEIVVVGHKSSGDSVSSTQSRISVSELASYVAMAVPAESPSNPDLDLIAEYLFEMGVNLEVFEEPLPLDFSDQAWDTVIWNGGDRHQASEDSITLFEALIQRGVSLYLMGEGLVSENENSEAIEKAWEQLTLMTPAEQQGLNGPIEFLKEGDVRLLKGRFGTLAAFTLDNFSGGQLSNPSADAFLQLGGLDLAASLEMDRSASGEGARRFVQLFSLAQANALQQTKTLFQNAVCWLLPDCFDCVNADLPPVVQGMVSDPILGQMMSVELLLANNGACEVSGAEIGVSNKGIEVTELLIDGENV